MIDGNPEIEEPSSGVGARNSVQTLARKVAININTKTRWSGNDASAYLKRRIETLDLSFIWPFMQLL